MDGNRITLHHIVYQITRPYYHVIVFCEGLLRNQIYRAPVRDLTDLEERIYATVNSVTPQMLHSTWVEVEYPLDISHVTNVSHVEVYGT